MPTPPKLIRRTVASQDPSLSAEANRLLTEELRTVIGAATVEVPADRPDHRRDHRAIHGPFVAALIDLRLGLVIAALLALVVLALIAVYSGSVLILIGAVAVLFAATAGVVVLASRLAGEREHVAPETAALLEQEGVGDPDRSFTELVDEFSPADEKPAGQPAARLS